MGRQVGNKHAGPEDATQDLDEGKEGEGEVEQNKMQEMSPPPLEGGSLGVPNAKQSIGGAEVQRSERVFVPPVRKQFVVKRASLINSAGGPATLKEGMIIDDLNYDIEQLKLSLIHI